MEKLFKVIRSSESKNGGFVTTLETQVNYTCPITGQVATTKKQVAVKTPVAAEVGVEVKIDLTQYTFEVYESTYVDEATGEERVSKNTWLHRKAL